MTGADVKRLVERVTADHWQLFNRLRGQTVGEFHVGWCF